MATFLDGRTIVQERMSAQIGRRRGNLSTQV
jgi:hypothetical protein